MHETRIKGAAVRKAAAAFGIAIITLMSLTATAWAHGRHNWDRNQHGAQLVDGRHHRLFSTWNTYPSTTWRFVTTVPDTQVSPTTEPLAPCVDSSETTTTACGSQPVTEEPQKPQCGDPRSGWPTTTMCLLDLPNESTTIPPEATTPISTPCPMLGKNAIPGRNCL